MVPFLHLLPILILDHAWLFRPLLDMQEAVIFQGSNQLFKGSIDVRPFLPFRERFDYRQVPILPNIKANGTVRMGRQIVIVCTGFIRHITGKGSCCHFHRAVPIIPILLVQVIKPTAIGVEVCILPHFLNIFIGIRFQREKPISDCFPVLFGNDPAVDSFAKITQFFDHSSVSGIQQTIQQCMIFLRIFHGGLAGKVLGFILRKPSAFQLFNPAEHFIYLVCHASPCLLIPFGSLQIGFLLGCIPVLHRGDQLADSRLCGFREIPLVIRSHFLLITAHIIIQSMKPLMGQTSGSLHFGQVDNVPFRLIMGRRSRQSLSSGTKSNTQIAAQGNISIRNLQCVGQVFQCVKAVVQRNLPVFFIQPVPEFSTPESEGVQVVLAGNVFAAPVVRPFPMHLQKLLGNKPGLPFPGIGQLLQKCQCVLITGDVMPENIGALGHKPGAIFQRILMNAVSLGYLGFGIGGKSLFFCQGIQFAEIPGKVLHRDYIVCALQSWIFTPFFGVVISAVCLGKKSVFFQPGSPHVLEIFCGFCLLRKFLNVPHGGNKIFLKRSNPFQILRALCPVSGGIGIGNVLIQGFSDFISGI